jgi:hypothetical protein
MARVLRPGGRLALSVDSLLEENSPVRFREWHRRRHYVTRYFTSDELDQLLRSAGFCPEPERTVHLFRSRFAGRVREAYVRHPRPLLPLFPVLYGAVRLADRSVNNTHGQIIIATATRSTPQVAVSVRST